MSRILNKAEKYYPKMKLKFLASKWALTIMETVRPIGYLKQYCSHYMPYFPDARKPFCLNWFSCNCFSSMRTRHLKTELWSNCWFFSYFYTLFHLAKIGHVLIKSLVWRGKKHFCNRERRTYYPPRDGNTDISASSSQAYRCCHVSNSSFEFSCKQKWYREGIWLGCSCKKSGMSVGRFFFHPNVIGRLQDNSNFSLFQIQFSKYDAIRNTLHIWHT